MITLIVALISAFTMPSVKVGDSLPQTTFTHIPWTPELENHSVCGAPVKLSTDEWKGKKVVLFAVPGAFTPTCHTKHLPPYIAKYDQFKEKGVDVIAVVASNDAFVMSGWGRFEGVKDKILTLSDAGAEFSKSLGLTMKFGGITRAARYAIILDDLKITYIEAEPAPTAVTVSSAEAVLGKL